MTKQKFSDMRSVSFTEEQGKAIDVQAAIESRSAGNLIRLATCKYLLAAGILLPQNSVNDPDSE